MSQMLPDINLSMVSSPLTIVPPGNLQASQISWIELQNISPYDASISAGSINIPIPAWDDFYYQVTDDKHNIISGFSLPIEFSFVLYGSLISTISTILRVTFYGLGETPTNTQSRQLVRQTWTPNPVTGVVGVANSVVNDGNPSGTSVGEATPFGSITSHWTLDNNGNEYLNGTLEVHGQITANQITAEPLNDLGFTTSAGQKEVWSIGGTHYMSMTSTLFSLLNGLKLNFPSLAISDMSFFGPYTVTTTATAFAHNMVSGTPQMFVLSLQGSSASPHQAYWDLSTVTSTQINLRGDGTLIVYGFAFKF